MAELIRPFFLLASLGISFVFLYLAYKNLQDSKLAQSDPELKYVGPYLRKRAILGGAFAINRLFWLTALSWRRLPWAESETALWILLGIWIFNEILTIRIWLKNQ